MRPSLSTLPKTDAPVDVPEELVELVRDIIRVSRDH